MGGGWRGRGGNHIDRKLWTVTQNLGSLIWEQNCICLKILVELEVMKDS